MSARRGALITTVGQVVDKSLKDIIPIEYQVADYAHDVMIILRGSFLQTRKPNKMDMQTFRLTEELSLTRTNQTQVNLNWSDVVGQNYSQDRTWNTPFLRTITMAMKLILNAALQAIVYIQPLHFTLKAEAAITGSKIRKIMKRRYSETRIARLKVTILKTISSSIIITQ